LVILLLAGCAEERALCDACPAPAGVHPAGYLDDTSHAFHGKDLERRGWSFALCQSCHGDDFSGKPGAPSCLSCHANGPTACDTCHGTPPTTGAHVAHRAQGFACSECHVMPDAWDTPGHILDEDRNPIAGPAKVTFGALANRDVTPPRRSAPASWDHDGDTCANVYCHGGVLADAAAKHAQPTWHGGPDQISCGGCHGKPPATHAQSECAKCHPTGGPGSTRHIDAVIDVGDGSGSCTGCHGDATSPAPPRGLHGETATSALAVGAHRAHLVAGRLRGPLACSECHRVPAAVTSAGHLDTALPADLEFGVLATTDGATPAWDRTTATCSSVYCHGGGTRLAMDSSPDKLGAPQWTANTATTIYCGRRMSWSAAVDSVARRDDDDPDMRGLPQRHRRAVRQHPRRQRTAHRWRGRR
jgi:predicted CxxxxCH...CXXCH cytochrome family protein